MQRVLRGPVPPMEGGSPRVPPLPMQGGAPSLNWGSSRGRHVSLPQNGGNAKRPKRIANPSGQKVRQKGLNYSHPLGAL